jgi:hypothetical protein
MTPIRVAAHGAPSVHVFSGRHVVPVPSGTARWVAEIISLFGTALAAIYTGGPSAVTGWSGVCYLLAR